MTNNANIKLLDCTLRDGGYVNDWQYSYRSIKGFCEKIAKTNVEFCEIGFLRGDIYDKERALFPDIESAKDVIGDKSKGTIYLLMYDTSTPIDLNRISRCDNTSIDGIRVIFKNTKYKEGYTACKKFQELGYKVFANFVNTEVWDEKELISAIKDFNNLSPLALTIVDTFGDLSNSEFMHLVDIFDKNLDKKIALDYHAHNNLQQAFQNAECLVEKCLNREVIIDGCVFGMGRGAGNLNLELFAKYLNEKYGKDYHIIPMLEIMDEYLDNIYKTKFWGYSLPLYISASLKVHPNYAIYLSNKNTLTEKALYDIMKMISDTDRLTYKKDLAEKYYEEYQKNLIDDTDTKKKLSEIFSKKKILLLAPGSSIITYKNKINNVMNDEDVVSIGLNFYNEDYKVQYVFSSNMRRYHKIDDDSRFKSILTSNMREAKKVDYMVNYTSLLSKEKEIDDNSGLMMLRLLFEIGIKKVYIAGMDGYNKENKDVYADEATFYDFSKEADMRNVLIKKELDELRKHMDIEFITPSLY